MLIPKSYIEELEIDLTGTCNLSCPLCTRNYEHAKHMTKYKERSVDEIIEQLDTYTNLQRFFIAGAVSEPTLYKDFFKFLKYLNSRDIYYELFTNGSTHTPAYWEELGKIVPEKCSVYFTICGSTQELHGKYRVGSSLQMILDNHEAYKKNGKDNDGLQHILFEYNQNDLNEGKMQPIIDRFSNVLYVESEGIRRINEYKKEFAADIKPRDARDRLIKSIFKTRPTPDDGKKYEIQCRSLEKKKLYIDNFGKVSACYIHAEFEKDYFEGDIMDYGDILDFKYSDCFLCEKRTRIFTEKLGMEFIC